MEYNTGMAKQDLTQINAMKEGGKILSSILNSLKSKIKVGLDIYDLEIEFLNLCEKYNAIPACKGYVAGHLPPFPTGLCIGINDEAVHGYPIKGRILKNGDLISVDTCIKYKGYHTDSAFTIGVGEISKENERFLNTAQLASTMAIKEAISGNRIGDISHVMESIMKMAGYDVLYDYVGHGIGENMHQAPDIPCFGDKGKGEKLKKGMTIAIEALCAQGIGDVESINKNDWPTRLVDGKNFAIFEHTVLIDNEPIILTK